MAQLTHFTFETRSGGVQTLEVQHYEKEISTEYYTGEPYNKAISGKLRPNFKGARFKYRVKFDVTIQTAEIRSLLNNLITDLVTNEEDHIFVTEGNASFGDFPVVPTDELTSLREYIDTFGKSSVTLEFVDYAVNQRTGGWVETGWVEDGWVE